MGFAHIGLPARTICYNTSMPDQLGESFRQARRELRFQLTAWCLFALWVVGFCGYTAFDAERSDVTTILGMPGWVFWGIAVPWIGAFVVTVYFSGWYMQDTDLVDDSETPDSTQDAAEESASS
jgi:uncharacterized membrane protein